MSQRSDSCRSLPRGWALATLPEIAGPDGIVADGDWVETKDQDPEGPVRLVQLADVGDGRFRDRSDRWMNREAARRLNCTFLQSGDVMIARMPDPLGRACLFPGRPEPCVTVVDVCIVRAPSVSADWLMYFINSAAVRAEIADYQTGSTRKRISRNNLCQISLRIPPHSEQRRIVDVIETQLTRLDAAVANLKRVGANLKRARASVLKAAVEGRLVPTEAELALREGRSYEHASVLLERILEERRRRHDEGQVGAERKKKYPPPAKPKAAELGKLPGGWVWATVDQLSTLVRNGYSRKPDDEGETPILRISAVRPCLVDRDDSRRLLAPISDFTNAIAQPGDLLFTRYNGTRALVGVCGVLGAGPPVVHPDKLVRVVPSTEVIPAYLEKAANSGESRAFLEQRIRTTAGQSGVSGSDIKAMPIPLPPLSEQMRIASEVDRRLTVLDAIGHTVEINLRRCERLRQSILKRAFEGKLVPQDPNDEPASELLARIQAGL